MRKPNRLEALYRQAVAAGWIQHSEANIRNFVCAALRANRAGGRVAAIFAGIVKNKLWHHITQEQETRALAVVGKFRESNPEAFSLRPKEGSMADKVLEGQQIRDELVSRVLKRDGRERNAHRLRAR